MIKLTTEARSPLRFYSVFSVPPWLTIFGVFQLPNVYDTPKIQKPAISGQLIQQRLGLDQIDGIKTLGKPAVNVGQHPPGFFLLPL